MAKVGYIKSLPRGEFNEWVEREFEAIERSVESINYTAEPVTETNYIYTISSGDDKRIKETTSSSPVSLIVPPSSTTSFEVGASIWFFQGGTGVARLLPDTGVTLVSRPGLQSAGQYAMFRIWQRSLDYWVASGDLVPSTTTMTIPSTASLVITGKAPTVT